MVLALPEDTFRIFPSNSKHSRNQGYIFSRLGRSCSSRQRPSLPITCSRTQVLKPFLHPAQQGDTAIVINEINYKSATEFDTEDWIELYNNGDVTIDLGNWQITDLSTNPAYVFPAGNGAVSWRLSGYYQ
jgi:hypothetical protein